MGLGVGLEVGVAKGCEGVRRGGVKGGGVRGKFQE